MVGGGSFCGDLGVVALVNDFKEVMKTQPLAKDPSKPHPNQAVPISIERHAMTFNEDLH